MANRPFSQVIHRSEPTGVRPRATGDCPPEPALQGARAQQPRQMFFIRAFKAASSALIASTYFAASTFGAGPVRCAGFARADDATGGAALS